MSVDVSLPRLDVPIIDTRSGRLTREWASFLQSIFRRTGGSDDEVDQANVLRYWGATEYQPFIDELAAQMRAATRQLANSPDTAADFDHLQKQIGQLFHMLNLQPEPRQSDEQAHIRLATLEVL